MTLAHVNNRPDTPANLRARAALQQTTQEPLLPLDLPLDAGLPWLARLTPAGHEYPASFVNAEQRSRVERTLGNAPVEWAIELGHEIANVLIAEFRMWEGSDEGLRELRRGTVATALQLLTALCGLSVDRAARPEALGCVADLARRQTSLDDMLRAIQFGHSVMATAFLAECDRLVDVAQRGEQMRALSARMFRFFDRFATEMSEDFHEERERWRSSDDAARLAIVQEILRGTGRLDERDRTRLRYELDAEHLGLVVWAETEEIADRSAELLSETIAALDASGAARRLILPVDSTKLWVWVAPVMESAQFRERLRRFQPRARIRFTLGTLSTGLDGFRASHEEALAAFTVVAAAPDCHPAIVSYDDVDVVSLLLADRDRARRFARRELRDLGADSAVAKELRATVAAYIDEFGSQTRAARAVNVSRNTVTNRLHRAAELLGRPLTERRTQLRSALLILTEIEAAEGAAPTENSRQ